MQSPSVLITGVSSGIGFSLAREYLQHNWNVFGTSRRTPDELMQQTSFHFAAHDLTDHAATTDVIQELLKPLNADDDKLLDMVVLNAGILGQFGDLADTPLTDLAKTMDVNVWANKTVLDAIFQTGLKVRQVVAISSGAAVNGHRGWSGYGISKAALNMFVKLYAAEQTETHFTALAPGVIDTAMQDQLCGHPPDERFPSLETLCSKRNSEDMPSPKAVAARLLRAFALLPTCVESGAFTDIRHPPLTQRLP